MPLYGKGLYRTSVFTVALRLNDILSIRRNQGLPKHSILKNGKVVSEDEVKRIFPDVSPTGLKGGAIWNDASMADSQRVLMEALKWACSLDSAALNYFNVTTILKEGQKVKGITAADILNGKHYNFYSDIVINSAGPWSRELANKFDKEYSSLFKPSLAWNVLFNKSALSDHALAVTPNKPNSRTYFLRPWKGMLFAGTMHEPWNRIEQNPMPHEKSIQNFIDELNSSIKNLNLKRTDVLHIFLDCSPPKKKILI